MRSTEVNASYEADQAREVLGWRIWFRPLLEQVCSRFGHRERLAGVDYLAIPRRVDHVCERCGATSWSVQ